MLFGVWKRMYISLLISRGKRPLLLFVLILIYLERNPGPVCVLPAVLGPRCQQMLTGTMCWYSPACGPHLNDTEPTTPNCESCSSLHLSTPQVFLLLESVFSKKMQEYNGWLQSQELEYVQLEYNHAHLSRTYLSFVFLSVYYSFYFLLNENSIEPIILEFEPEFHSVTVKIKQGKLLEKYLKL